MSGGLRHDESVCQRSKLENLRPVEKQAYPRPLVNNGSGPLHCPERRFFHFNGFYFVVLGTNGEALLWLQMNQHSGYLLQREHAAGSGGGNYT